MKRSIKMTSVAAFAFAAAIVATPGPFSIVANAGEQINRGYEFEEVETAQAERGKSIPFEFEEVETAQNEQKKSRGYEFPDVETA